MSLNGKEMCAYRMCALIREQFIVPPTTHKCMIVGHGAKPKEASIEPSVDNDQQLVACSMLGRQARHAILTGYHKNLTEAYSKREDFQPFIIHVIYCRHT